MDAIQTAHASAGQSIGRTKMIKRLYQDEDGLTTVEYALLLALLVVAAIGVWTAFGTKLKTQVSKSTVAFDNAANA